MRKDNEIRITADLLNVIVAFELFEKYTFFSGTKDVKLSSKQVGKKKYLTLGNLAVGERIIYVQ